MPDGTRPAVEVHRVRSKRRMPLFGIGQSRWMLTQLRTYTSCWCLCRFLAPYLVDMASCVSSDGESRSPSDRADPAGDLCLGRNTASVRRYDRGSSRRERVSDRPRQPVEFRDPTSLNTVAMPIQFVAHRIEVAHLWRDLRTCAKYDSALWQSPKPSANGFGRGLCAPPRRSPCV